MSFDLPETAPVNSTILRELEHAAPNVTPKNIRAALLRAAQKLEGWEQQAEHCVRILEEAIGLRVGFMDSESKSVEVNRQVKNAIREASERLRAQQRV